MWTHCSGKNNRCSEARCPQLTGTVRRRPGLTGAGGNICDRLELGLRCRLIGLASKGKTLHEGKTSHDGHVCNKDMFRQNGQLGGCVQPKGHGSIAAAKGTCPFEGAIQVSLARGHLAYFLSMALDKLFIIALSADFYPRMRLAGAIQKANAMISPLHFVAGPSSHVCSKASLGPGIGHHRCCDGMPPPEASWS